MLAYELTQQYNHRMSLMHSAVEQSQLFSQVRNQIDYELRHTGFEEFATQHGLDPKDGLLVVGRYFQYSSQLADIDRDLDPTAIRLGVQYELGVMKTRLGGYSYKGLLVSEAIEGENQEPAGPGLELDYIQLLTVRASVARLLKLRMSGELRYLTKSLLKIDVAGD